jgi:hypothetical protein
VPSVDAGFDIANAPSTKTNVPIISVSKLKKEFLIAGAQQKTASFPSLSSVTSKCCLYASHTIIAPVIAPPNCARI